MPKVIDLKGRRFGKILVISKTEKRKDGKIMWLCKCDCGIEKEIVSTNLIKGDTKSCGCLRIIKFRNEIESGTIFGNLKTIRIEKIEKVKYKSGRSQIVEWWLCECKCGNVHITRSGDLNSGQCKSCGCLSESWIAKQLKDYFIKNYNGIAEYRIFKNPETGYFLPFDIYLPNYKIFIEINGSQHYEFFERYHKDQEGFEYSKKKDEMKKKFAKKNGTFIEIDLRKIKKVEQAIEKIEKIINNLKQGDKINE